ncbi:MULTISPECIES: immune inhibitor A domain-containing protein [unclassified Bacillus (in: firmicutes)]|uniref:immune inhibitor A domain-containing protein n=1 Tax=unclassified Bacillus (in: firmicutes) TaxID=185979 RepID=UPI00080B2E97|nr:MULTISPECIES: immune inhibitor A domain-containing protein [unclassified Bacillus (in: firmicutes)]
MVNWKKVMGTSVLSASLVFTSFGSLFGNVDKVEAKTSPVLHTHDDSALPFMSKHASGPFDIGMVNEEKVLASLIEQGIISKNASKDEQQKKLLSYLKNRADKAEALVDDPKEARNEIQKKTGLDPVAAGIPKESKKEKIAAKKTSPDSIVEENWDGEVIEDEVLVLLIDFPDYPHSSITQEDNPVLLYDDYSKEHYEEMVFGDTTYKGGNDEDFISMKAYYEEQSGGSYTIDGVVSDWYTAKHPAAYYGGNYPTADGSDIRPRDLVQEALEAASKDPNIDLSQFDREDLYDLDGDGDYREPDGIIDHLMIVHSGTGEEAGGGAIGADAIWSHSWSLAEPTVISGTEGQAEVPYWGGGLTAYDYTIQPEDGATGVFAHEFGHDLGLPDEYDTNYTAGGVGAPTDYWTIMASGSWAGIIGGTEPTGFSPYDKEYLQNKWPNSNWFKPVEYSLDDIMNGTKTLNIDQASMKGTNADAIRVSLPNKKTVINTPTSGEYEYHSGSGNDLNNDLVTTVDLTKATEAALTFNANYDIEENWDYASVQVDEGSGWKAIPGNITTDQDPEGYGQNPGHGITGTSNGWVNASFDLSAYAGKEIKLKINYWTDSYVAMPGLYVDDLVVTIDGEEVIVDDAESDESLFTLEGFAKSNGLKESEHYYLVEWRNWAAADTALGRITRGNSVLTLDPGMVVWYVDNLYDNNWVGDHPGDGFLGVVDAHQATAAWSDGAVASTRYQIQDAAFSLNPTDKMFIDYLAVDNTSITLPSQPAVPTFNDYKDYSNPGQIYSGRNVPKYGLNISVLSQAEDNSVAQIQLSYDDHNPKVEVSGLNDTYSSNEGYNTLDLSVISDDEALDQDITVTAKVVNKEQDTVVSAEQKYVSDLEEKELNFQLTLPEKLESGEYTLEVTVATADKVIVSKTDTFNVDNEAPIPDVGENNGSTEPINQVSVTVNIPDAKDDTLEYLWSESEELDSVEAVTAKGMKNSVTELNAWKPFKNGDTLTLEGQSGIYYLHVRGKDVLDNTINWTSNAFTVDADVPVITLEGDNPFVIQAGTEYVEPGFAANDNVDGDVTSSVEVTGLESLDVTKPGEYVLTYTVSDTAGNSGEVQRKIHVVDEEKPYISLTEGNVEIEVGDEYTEPGYTAIDNVDGDVTDKVEVAGDVDTSTPGEYTLTYTVTDSSDNSYSVTRIVKVIDTTAPVLALEGEEKIIIEGGTEYVEPGYTATDNVDGNLTEAVEVYGSVDVTKVGDYELKYHVIDSSGNEAIAIRTVTVQDTTAPVIKLSGEDTITLDLGQAYLEPGFTATDTLDGNITDQVVVSGTLRFEVGTYTITYTVTDAAGNESTAKRTVKVADKTAPNLTLKGSSSITLTKGEKYEEPGYKARDNVDGDLTDEVIVSGKVDTNKVGAYTLTYTVTDSSGNKTSVERIIIVNEEPATDTDDNKGGSNNGGSDNDTDSPSDSKGGTVNNGKSNGTNTTGNASSQSGSNLPNTATSTYNWILAGTIIIVAGISLFIIQRRRKA